MRLPLTRGLLAATLGGLIVVEALVVPRPYRETGGVQAAVLGAPVVSPAQSEPPVRVLFLGDSQSWCLDHYFTALAASGEHPLAVDCQAMCNRSLAIHWIWEAAAEKIRTGNWDVVVLQEDMAEYWVVVDLFKRYVPKLDGEIKRAGARTVLYMTWQYSDGTPPTIEQIAAVHHEMADQLGATVAPVGLAFQRASRERPDLVLLGSDDEHPSPQGYYLALCVLYATLFDRSPEGLTYRLTGVPTNWGWGLFWGITRDWQLPDTDAAFLQHVAWETVGDYRTEGVNDR